MLLLGICLISCQPQAQKKEKISASNESLSLSTKTDKTLNVIELKNQAGLSDIVVIPKGFEFSQDSLKISDADPLSAVFLADLDANGFEEIYMVTCSTGSGSYGSILAYASNSDKSLSPIYVRPISENDLAPGALFEGYMGHDSIFLEETFLKRSFPKYKAEDPNCCPTGGTQTIVYQLKAGEASWQLEPRTP